jgi:exodeoxyribonuclease VII large subunit
VGELVRQVRGLVERSYGSVAVEGEISNWRPAGSGHCYFTLKDGTAQLPIVMFRREAARLRFKPKDGDAVRLRGQLSVYESRGQMQLVAESMEQVGLGAMLAAVRELKERLRREGLFERKRPLPAFPKCIGVVTSLQGAALRDIVKVCRRRHAAVRLLIYPAAVQGPNCAREIAAGVRWFSKHSNQADVVIVARGGGSWEDLHGFDDEGITRAIAACAVPVIVGVGHATDSTIADAAADVCAPTPSAAAELVTAAQYRVEERLARLAARLERAGRYEMLLARQRLSRLSAEGVLRRVQDGLRRREQRLDELESRVEVAARRGLRVREERVVRLTARLERQHVALRLERDRRRLEAATGRLIAVRKAGVEAGMARVSRAQDRLEALSPLRVLERGYALVYGPDGRLLKSTKSIILGERIVARLADGSLGATVFGKKE